MWPRCWSAPMLALLPQLHSAEGLCQAGTCSYSSCVLLAWGKKAWPHAGTEAQKPPLQPGFVAQPQHCSCSPPASSMELAQLCAPPGSREWDQPGGTGAPAVCLWKFSALSDHLCSKQGMFSVLFRLFQLQILIALVDGVGWRCSVLETS